MATLQGLLCVLGLLAQRVGAHSPPAVLGVTCDVSRPELAPVTSYHAHVHFLQNNNASRWAARSLRAKFVAEFFGNESAVAHCSADFEQAETCLWQNDPCLGPVGPFATAQFAAYVTVGDFERVVAFFLQHRGALSVLVHPNTGCNALDHSAWPLWLGAPWKLDLTQFEHEPAPLEACPDAAHVPRAYYPCCGTWDRLV